MKEEKNMDDLKQELEMDEHSCELSELLSRHSSDINRVSFCVAVSSLNSFFLTTSEATSTPAEPSSSARARLHSPLQRPS